MQLKKISLKDPSINYILIIILWTFIRKYMDAGVDQPVQYHPELQIRAVLNEITS